MGKYMEKQKKWEEAKSTTTTTNSESENFNKILDSTLADIIRTDILYYISTYFKEDNELNRMLIKSLERTVEDLRFYINERRES